jgi:hypothetical protein
MKVILKIEDDSGRIYQGEILLSAQGEAKKIQRKKEKHAVSESPRTPAQALRSLHAQGVFKSERALAVVEAELAKIDCNFPKASLAKALERADFLTRRGTRGSYRWIQKFNPGG